MKNKKILVFIPTYNERKNVDKICLEILDQKVDLDILFLDDNSPDGTGEVIDELANRYLNVFSLHRPQKSGIGSAHTEGISWAYSKNYDLLITMDCDFSHPPKYIPDFIKGSQSWDVVVGSRYMARKSLEEWNVYRKFLTNVGHFLTSVLLGMKFDASGAFRAYDLKRIKRDIFQIVSSKSYSFFFESLYILYINKNKIKEIPIHLPARAYGHSKMRIKDIFKSLSFLIGVYLNRLVNNERYHNPSLKNNVNFNSDLFDPQDWDSYWKVKDRGAFVLYDVIAAFYRKYLIRKELNKFVTRHFKKGSRILHAGCGSGQVDTWIRDYISIHGLDISKEALIYYSKVNGNRCKLIHGDLMEIPSEDGYFDGIYNLGVMEHFAEESIIKILREFNRVLKEKGKIILFWPPVYGASVIFLKTVRFVLNGVFRKNVKFHPDEPSRIRSKAQIKSYFRQANFDLIEFRFGPSDFFTYAVVVGQRNTMDVSEDTKQ